MDIYTHIMADRFEEEVGKFGMAMDVGEGVGMANEVATDTEMEDGENMGMAISL